MTERLGADPDRGVLVGARIVTPGDWSDLDLDPTTRHRSIVAAVRRAVARDPVLAGNAVRLIRLLDDVAVRAYDSGAFFCSSLVQGDAREDHLLLANVLTQITPDADEPPSGLTAVEFCAGLAATVSADPDWDGADVGVVTLPDVGPAVRIELVAGGVCLQYLVPVGRSGRVAILTFTSPCGPYAGALLPLFDSMAASFAFEYAPAATTPFE